MNGKPIIWLGSSLADLRSFSEIQRRGAGHELQQVQQGLTPSDWKPMASVGAGVFEIRIRTGIEHRIFYVAKFDEAVYVLHSFEKKAQKTPKRDIESGKKRYAELMHLRQEHRRGRNR